MPAVPTLLALPLLGMLAVAPPASADDLAAHEATLTEARVKADGPGLLAFFRARTLTEGQQARLADLVKRLGDDDFDVREKASADLLAAGRQALPFLRPALKADDREVKRRAQRAVDVLQSAAEAQTVAAAAAVLAARKPAGTTAALLAYLPFADEATVEQTILDALAALHAADPKPDPDLMAAVSAKAAIQRAAAGWVLGRSSRPAARAAALPLLKDPAGDVRLRAATALLAGRDRAALPALIALLEDDDKPEAAERAAQAEMQLANLAGDRSPDVALGTTPAERRNARVAWEAWYKEYGGTLDLAKLDVERRVLGLRLVAVLNGHGGQGAVFEYGADHKNRWEMTNVGGPFDARVLPGGHLLVGEYEGKRVTERDRSGKVLWEYKNEHGVLEVQRLASGNTLVVTNHTIREVTRAGRVVFEHKDAGSDIFTAQRLANGNTLYGLYTGALVELDRTGKELRRVTIERPSMGLISLEVLPTGRYLIPFPASNRVVEMDPNGKVIWQVSINSPTSAALLPGGTLLVGSHRNNSVREIDRKGNVLWEKRCEGQVFRVRAR